MRHLSLAEITLEVAPQFRQYLSYTLWARLHLNSLWRQKMNLSQLRNLIVLTLTDYRSSETAGSNFAEMLLLLMTLIPRLLSFGG